MKAYEEQKYAVWKEQINTTLMTYLKRNLLTKPHLTSASGGRQTEGTTVTDAGVLKSISMQKSQG